MSQRVLGADPEVEPAPKFYIDVSVDEDIDDEELQMAIDEAESQLYQLYDMRDERRLAAYDAETGEEEDDDGTG